MDDFFEKNVIYDEVNLQSLLEDSQKQLSISEVDFTKYIQWLKLRVHNVENKGLCKEHELGELLHIKPISYKESLY